MQSAQILVVEDDPALRTMLSWELEDLGLKPVSAASCAEALRMMRRPCAESCSFALIDLDLPDGDGEQLAKMLVADFPSLRVVLTSGRRRGIGETIAERDGIVGFLIKPLDPARLCALLGI